ncbi:kinase-like domain-containing protein [Syncephalis plumigaleata]|nr:kinase-like domain-containing protein [Syncephalis plumigaleata]
MRYYTMYNGSTTTTTTTKTRAIESDGTPKGKQPRRRRRKQMQDDTNGQAMSERKSTKSTSNNEVTTKVVETIETMNDGDTQRTNSTTLTKTTSDMNGDITAVDTLVTTNTTSANTNNTTAIATRLRKDSNGNSVINSLTITNEILGHGSHGTIVFKGDFGGKKVAVKRQLLDYYDLVDHEVAILQESDDHPNVIRYYCRERCDRFLYIAFELCQTTLHEAVESAHRGQPSLLNHLSKAQLLYQIASGLYHLHSLKLVHRDLKPHNILVMSKVRSHSTTTDDHQAKNIEVRVLISDFGLSKRLEADQSSFGDATLRQGSGTVGWRAQELMRATDSELLINGSSSNDSSSSSHDGRTKRRVIKAYTNMSTTETPDDNPTEMPTTKPRVTKAIDVFAAGCVFYHALTGGDHPFGDRYERESNILKNNYDLSGLSMDNVAEAEARDLISAMIQYQPEHRPTIGQVLLHPFFWSNEKRLAFLQDASDRFEAEPRDTAASPLLQKLEANSISVVGLDWSKRLDKSMLSQLGKFRRYDVQSVRDLLRAIRNKKHHFKIYLKLSVNYLVPYPMDS